MKATAGMSPGHEPETARRTVQCHAFSQRQPNELSLVAGEAGCSEPGAQTAGDGEPWLQGGGDLKGWHVGNYTRRVLRHKASVKCALYVRFFKC